MKQPIREKIISRLKRIDIVWWTQYLLIGSLFLLHGVPILIHAVQGTLNHDDTWRFMLLFWIFYQHMSWMQVQIKNSLLQELFKEHDELLKIKIEQDTILYKLSNALSRVDKSVLSKYGIHISETNPYENRN